MEELEILEGSIELPKGFLASGIFAGIKKAKRCRTHIFRKSGKRSGCIYNE